MKLIYLLPLLLSAVGCDNKAQHVVGAGAKIRDTSRHVAPNPYGLDSTYKAAIKHQPFLLSGYFNADKILDTAVIVTHKVTGKDALWIKHGGNAGTFLLKSGKDVMTDFDDFNWIGEFKIVKKGIKIWDNVIDGEIVGGDQVSENKKFVLQTDGIFVHVDEAGGGGIIYFKGGRYNWVQQD